MKILWDEEAWRDLNSYLLNGDKKSYKKIISLIEDIDKNGVDKGIGKPEALKCNLSGMYSREINEKDRLVYKIDENGNLRILQCKTHYDKM